MGLFGPIGEDSRAPTPRSADANTPLTHSARLDLITLTELLLTALVMIGCVAAFHQGRWWLILMLLNDLLGYGWVGAQSVWEILKMNSRRMLEAK